MFFDITPNGRILSRFSKDIEVLDKQVPDNILWLLYCIFEVMNMHFHILFSEVVTSIKPMEIIPATHPSDANSISL